LTLYVDETLTCTDCNTPFLFGAGEQEFFASKGFTNKPNRCPDCRAARKAQRGSSGGGGGSSYSGGGGGGSYGGGSGGGGGYSARPQREMFSATCSQCGKDALVPFQPRGDKPVYCRDCFQTRSNSY
jgi:CxxC-x17-CxxC domain-containing protein